MNRTPIWKDEDFPHYYCNPAAVAAVESRFSQALEKLVAEMDGEPSEEGTGEILVEETVKNSQIEGVNLNRESVRSSFLNNLPIRGGREKGAVTVTRMATDSAGKPLTDARLREMHRSLFEDSDMPENQRGVYVGGMQIVSGGHLDREPVIEDLGLPKEQVGEAMAQFLEWFNTESDQPLLTRVIQGHLHFEAIHPFADGNGRIGRALMQMTVSQKLGKAIPLALSRAISQNPEPYYRQFKTGLDLTAVVKEVGEILIAAVQETASILELTRLRGQVNSHALNARQEKVINRLIEYELTGRPFQGGLSNQNYRKMSGAEERMALRDLAALVEQSFLLKSGRLKGTRYHLNLSKNCPQPE
jgi:Fic family protein